MRSILFLGVLGGLLAGCSASSNQASSGALASAVPAPSVPSAFNAPLLSRGHSTIASLPDRGDLVAYAGTPALHQGAETWHAVQLSEAHALRAIADGGMVVNAPNGQPVRLKYERFVEHSDGNWSWIGRPEGSPNAPEAVLTFGEKAVFGSIPFGNQPALQVQTRAGRTWLVETDARKLAAQPHAAASDTDMLAAPVASAAAHTATSAPAMQASGKQQAPGTQALTANSSNASVDLVLGYSTGLKTRLGGTSQVNTRLNFLVDVANQALANSQVSGRLRLLATVEVGYSDTVTSNRDALFELTGQTCSNVPVGALHLPDADVNCVDAAVPSALAPLVSARAKYGADLVSLVRDNQPAQQTCGVAWVIGGGQTEITKASAAFGYSVISDSSGGACRSETLAHEVGHNLGLVHDRVSAAGGDDSDNDNDPLDLNEYGRFAYSFGYNTADFYTVMSLPVSGATSYRVFSNPRVTLCGGAPCGVAGEADNARTLAQTMPLVAAFRGSRTQVGNIGLSGDYNGDGRADILWHDPATGNNSIWLTANSRTTMAMTAVTNVNWVIAGIGDFNGDHKSDVLWRDSTNGRNTIWLSANSATPQAVATQADIDWEVAGVADFNGDGKADILWRNSNTGGNVIWKSGNSGTRQSVTALADTNWVVGGVGDFDGDGKADILWHHAITGRNAIWKSGNSSTSYYITQVTDTNWNVAGVGDVNGDGKADIVWRKAGTGSNAVWLSGNSSTTRSMTAVSNLWWNIAALGDFNGDGKVDVMFRNSSSGANTIWRSADSSTPQDVANAGLKWVPAS